MKKLLALFLLLPFSAAADSPLFYAREQLSIERQSPPPLPWQQGQQAISYPFTVEARDGESYYKQKDWFSLNAPDDKSGILLLFERAAPTPLTKAQYYAPLDVLFIAPDGRISNIVRNVRLSTLAQPIEPPEAVLAFLLLKGGLTQRLGIESGDKVQHRAFTNASIAEPEKPAEAPQQPVIILQDTPHEKDPATDRTVKKRRDKPKTEKAPEKAAEKPKDKEKKKLSPAAGR